MMPPPKNSKNFSKKLFFDVATPDNHSYTQLSARESQQNSSQFGCVRLKY